MAGSGKSTLMRALDDYVRADAEAAAAVEGGTSIATAGPTDADATPPPPIYLINLDPAAAEVDYPASIDIRDTVNYKGVMAEYGLGPNGGIVTALNLFATRFDQVVSLIEALPARAAAAGAPPPRLVAVDTPGQIEVFTWSASGAVMTDALAGSGPTAIAFVVDGPRCASPTAFVANMLQACSILYRTGLPLLLVFNKADAAGGAGAVAWLEDWEGLAGALEGEGSYAATLSRSLSLALDEFYSSMPAVSVSAATGAGMDALLKGFDACKARYITDVLPGLRARLAARDATEADRQAADLARLALDDDGGDGGEPQKGGLAAAEAVVERRRG
jgi:GTPase SAR1 family protein